MHLVDPDADRAAEVDDADPFEPRPAVQRPGVNAEQLGGLLARERLRAARGLDFYRREVVWQADR